MFNYKYFATLWLLVLGISYGNDHAENGSNEPKKEPMEFFLFSFSATSAIMTTEDGYIDSLTIREKNVDEVLMFSDRPNRVVQEITLSNLDDIWHTIDDDNFVQDPPNAVLRYEYNDKIYTHIVELVNFELDSGLVMFDIERKNFPTKGFDAKVDNLLIVIDDVGEAIAMGIVKALPEIVPVLLL